MDAGGTRTLLLVEDEAILAMSEKMQLERYGYKVVVARNGDDAARIGVENPEIDLVLMDINLGPGIDGTVAARSILEARDVPILFLSSHTEPDVVEKTESITSYGYMVKNTSVTALDASIKMAFKLYQAKQELYEKKVTLEAALDSMSDAVFISDREGRLLEYNKAFSANRLFSAETGNDPGKPDYPSDLEVLSPDGTPASPETWAVPRALRGEAATDAEYTLRRKDTGETAIVSYNFGPIRDGAGHIVGSVVVGRDITDARRAEAKIHEADIRLRKLFANIPDLVFQFTRRRDGSYHVPIASPGIKNIFGCSPEDVAEDFGPIGRVLHPDDAARVIADIEFSAEHLTYFTCEFRVILPDRGVQWIYSRSSPERMPDGGVTWHGFNANITELKLEERETARARAILQAVIESPGDLVIMAIDRDYRYLCFNEAHKEAMRAAYGSEADIGVSILELISSEEDRVKAKENYDRALSGESHATLQEYGEDRKSLFESRYNPIKNEIGEIIGVTAFARVVPAPDRL